MDLGSVTFNAVGTMVLIRMQIFIDGDLWKSCP